MPISRPDGATLYIVGDVVSRACENAGGTRVRRLEGGAPRHRHACPACRAARPYGPRLILVDAPGAQQTSITVGAVLPPFDKDKAAAETLVAAALADIRAGRLNRNLRQDKGWTYGFGRQHRRCATRRPGFVASGTVQADKTADSLAELARANSPTSPPRGR